MAVKNDISIQTFVAAKENGFACSDRCGTDFPRPIPIFVAAKKNGPPAMLIAAAIFRVRFHSPLLRSRMVSPAGRRDNDLPRPILFFVAAKENGFAGSGRSGRALSVAER